MKKQPVTETQKKAVVETVLAVAEAIKSLGSVPSGHLYARLMGHMNLESYTKVIELLKNAGLVKESGHLLTWIGPKD